MIDENPGPFCSFTPFVRLDLRLRSVYILQGGQINVYKTADQHDKDAKGEEFDNFRNILGI
jgi:hypothetical protein